MKFEENFLSFIVQFHSFSLPYHICLYSTIQTLELRNTVTIRGSEVVIPDKGFGPNSMRRSPLSERRGLVDSGIQSTS